MRIPQLTFTRFIAAFFIVVFHYGKTVFPFSVPFLKSLIDNLNVLVSYFFILSGFVLAVSSFKSLNEGKKITLVSFLPPRLARLYPLMIFSLIIFLILSSKVSHTSTEILLSATMMQAWFPHYPLALNSPAWAISVEFLFYLAFPFLINFLFKIKSKNLVFITMSAWLINSLILFLNMNVFESSKDFTFFFPPFHLLTFIVGICAGLLFMRHQNLLIKYSNSIKVLTFMAIIASFYLFISNNIILKYQHNGLFAPTFLLFIYWFSISKDPFSKLFSLPLFQYLGELSYAIYILQVPVFLFFLNFLHNSFHFETNYGFCVYILLLLVVAILAFELVEKPCKKIIMKMIK
jgi:peptidoglycan/LPS O-acetylase OafA/YrhL